MGCFSKENIYKKTSTKRTPAVFVTPCIGTLGGEATVFVPEDSVVRWENNDNVVLDELSTSQNGRSVSRLAPGNYSVYIDDNNCKIEFEVQHSNYPTITGYKIKNASGELSRDGEIEAITNVPDGLDVLLGWSNSSFTTCKTLQSVKPGIYVATILQIGGKAVPCIHSTTPATVGVKGDEPNERLLTPTPI